MGEKNPRDSADKQRASIDTSTGRSKEISIKPDERGHTQIAPAAKWGSSNTGVWDPPTQRGK